MCELVPAGSEQQARREGLLERGLSLDALLTVPTAMQGLSGEVEVDGRMALVERDVDCEVGVVGIDVWPLPAHLPQPIAEGVLHLEGGELGVAQARIGPVRLDRDGGASSHVLLPGEADTARIERVTIMGVKARTPSKPAAHRAKSSRS